ncbi:hypothetical protein ACFQMH_41650 [Streptomyces viridiviolaceus]|uniref:Uncharacterized protein n=1 Tax=Streptomyces viridiviolaceus TaxID=68282 RepID=A0ABW2EG81_9ACTN|nr:hypothetical protein [Streptomyces viridiviolaceus]
MNSDPDERFHLTLTAAGHRTMQGWWRSETVARRKFVAWIGSYGALPNARITLVDEETGIVLATWPQEA